MNKLLKLLAALFIISLTFSNRLYSQTETGLSLGLADFHQKDPYILPDVYRATLFTSSIFFSLNAGQSRHEASLRFSYGHPDAQMKLQELTEESGSLSYSYLRRLGDMDLIGNKLNYFLGAGISSFLIITDVVTSTGVSPVHTSDQSWYWSHSLNLLLEGEYVLTEQRTILARLLMPVFRNVSRPENGHWLNQRNSRIITASFLHAAEGGKPEYLWNNFVVQCELEYSQPLGRLLDLKAQYLFYYASSEKPFTMGMYMNHFLVGLAYKF